jgi:iron complex outermembrane receptor protein
MYLAKSRLLPALLAFSLPLPVFGQSDTGSAAESPDRIHGSSHDHDVLEEVIVTATPLSRNVIEMSQSATVLSGAALDREVANNLGDTLARIPGLSNASFGQNVGRPVIRGFDGARVGVLNNNMGAADASAVSQDHAVAVEPFLADQIEVLRGPATLLYGSGAIGGVVNMVTRTIPEEVPEGGYSGRAMMQGDSAADQRMAAGRLDMGQGHWAFHASGFIRRTDDYEIPGEAELYHDEEEEGEHEEGHEDEERHGILENSFLDNDGGSLGFGYIGEKWRMGLSYTNYSSEYGIPGAHGHHHEEEGHEGEEHEEESHDEEETLVSIDLESDRWEGELVGTEPFGGFEQFKLRVVSTDYTHTEFEGDEVGTVFSGDTLDSRVELRHKPWGAWSGAFGGQYTDRDFDAIGEEAFVPPSSTRTAALFWVESAEFGKLQIDTGLRYDDISTTEAAGRKRDFSPFTASLGAVWHLTDSAHLTFNAAHAERAPTDQELFANGPHIATQTFEVGNDQLDTEANLHLEAGFRLHQGNLTGSLTFYTDDFDDYIYQADTGDEDDGLPVRLWSQQDADFQGAELELRYDLGRHASGHWQVSGFFDTVKAELSDGSNVPRIPPQRFGLGLDWDLKGFAANVSWIQASSHTRIAGFETPTPGYDLLNLDVSYLLPTASHSEWELFFKGHNLLDEDIRNSTSFLKDQAPQIGRNVTLGLRAYF